MSYRPLSDVMILARSKTKYYGAFPAGFLSRGRDMLGVGPDDAVLHVCGGKVREYPFKGLGPNDMTVDIDPACKPDFLMDVRKQLPRRPVVVVGGLAKNSSLWDAVMIDRPYSVEDATHYACGSDVLPDLNKLVSDAFDVIPPGHCVGVLDYLWPHPGKKGTEVFVTAVGTGRNSRARWYTVFRKN